MANYSIFDFGELFQLDSPLTSVDPAGKSLTIDFVNASVIKGTCTLFFSIIPLNLNPHHLQAAVTLRGLADQSNITQRLALYNGSHEYSLTVATTRLIQRPGAVLEDLRFTLSVSCDGQNAVSAPFFLKSEAVATAEAAGNTTDEVSISREAINNLPHPVEYAFSNAEIDQLFSYAEAYSKGKYPDSKYTDVSAPEAKAAREDAHADLLELNSPLLRPQDMQLFLQNPDAYIARRAVEAHENPDEVGPNDNLCIHLYTRQIASIKYGSADRYTNLRAAAEKVPSPGRNKPALPPGKTSQDWSQLTQSDSLVRTDEAILLAILVPSVRIAGNFIPLSGHLIADVNQVRQTVKLSGHDLEGEPTQINPHVGYFLEQYMKQMPVNKAFVFGMGVGHGYHSIMVAAKRETDTKTLYIILDDHMQHELCVAARNLTPTFLTGRKTYDKKVVDYFIQAYTGGAWNNYTQRTLKYPPPSPGWPLTTDIFLLRPKKSK